MYIITKTLTIAGSHRLNLPYPSRCNNIHGHNWRITICCKAEGLDEYGMVVDFSMLKTLITDWLDHSHLNDTLGENPTAERIAFIILRRINAAIENKKHSPKCYKVFVEESEGNGAIYEEV